MLTCLRVQLGEILIIKDALKPHSNEVLGSIPVLPMSV